MLHAVFVEPGRVEWREAPTPSIQGPLEAMVRPIAVGRCDLDVAYLRGLLPLKSGEPIGHEIIAEIVETGDGVRRFSQGERVFVPAQISCGTCLPCLSGATARCRSVPPGASFGMGRAGGFGGGLADVVRVPFADAMLSPLPAHADPVKLIGLADMATDAWRGVGPQLRARPGGSVLVIGGMPPVIGLYAAGMAVRLGASAVDYLDEDASRAAVARSYGARTPRRDELGPATYEIVFVANTGVDALEMAFAAVAPGGFLTSATATIGGYPTLDTASLYHKGVTWTIGRPDTRSAHDGTMQAWSCCGFDPAIVPTERVEWDLAAEAWSSGALYVVAVRD